MTARAIAISGCVTNGGMEVFNLDYGGTKFYCRASRWITPLFQSSTGLPGTIRNIGFPVLGRIKFTRTEILSSLAGLKAGLFRHLPPEYFVRDKNNDSI